MVTPQPTLVSYSLLHTIYVANTKPHHTNCNCNWIKRKLDKRSGACRGGRQILHTCTDFIGNYMDSSAIWE